MLRRACARRDGRGQPRGCAARFRPGALFTKNQTAQLVAQSLGLLRIALGAKAFGKLEKRLLFLFPRFDAEFDEFDEFPQNPVIAQALALSHALYLFVEGCGERYAPTDRFRRGHSIIDTPILVHLNVVTNLESPLCR
jgi:hypothetical protein